MDCAQREKFILIDTNCIIFSQLYTVNFALYVQDACKR